MMTVENPVIITGFSTGRRHRNLPFSVAIEDCDMDYQKV
jgi:hypothetical protein